MKSEKIIKETIEELQKIRLLTYFYADVEGCSKIDLVIQTLKCVLEDE